MTVSIRPVDAVLRLLEPPFFQGEGGGVSDTGGGRKPFAQQMGPVPAAGAISGLFGLCILAWMTRRPIGRWALTSRELLERGARHLIAMRRGGTEAYRLIEGVRRLLAIGEEAKARQMVLEASVKTDIRAVREFLATAARHLGVSTSAISLLLSRGRKIS